MGIRAGITSIGSGIATFLITAVLVMEAVGPVYDEPEVAGLLTGVVAGLFVGAGMLRWYGATPTTRQMGVALATFGYVTVPLLGVAQAVPALEPYLTPPAVATVGVLAAAMMWARVRVREITTR